MALLLDSALPEDIQAVIPTGVCAGVTTNPSIMAKLPKGASYQVQVENIARQIRELDPGKKDRIGLHEISDLHLSVEVIDPFGESAYTQARLLNDVLMKYKIANRYIKIPITFENLSVIKRLQQYGIKVNATAAMTAWQAKLAFEAGAAVVSFFYNRMIDGYASAGIANGRDRAMNEIGEASHYGVPIICGSIRKIDDVDECLRMGAKYVTIPRRIFEEMTKHPKTDEAIANFTKDIQEWLK